MNSKYILTALAVFILSAGPAVSQNERTGTISVRGEGVVSARPDMATVRIGVQNRAASADEALAVNTGAVKKLFQTLDRFGVAEADRLTTGLNISPVYGKPPSRGAPRPIDGFQVSNQVRILVRNLDQLGALLRDLVADGANSLSGVAFGVEQKTSMMDRARRLAVQDARRRAELFAEEAGVAVGRVIEISEQGISRPAPIRQSAARVLAEAVPIAPGNQDFRAGVSVLFAIR